MRTALRPEADRLAVVIPVYGRQKLTDQLVSNLEADNYPCTVWIVDNRGDYDSRGREHVVVAPNNLQWAGGCNLGMREAIRRTPDDIVLLNNDVYISPGFLDGLVTARRETGAALVGPMYDCNWQQQRGDYLGTAAEYKPAPVEREVPFIDGTCMLISADALATVGLLDDATWPVYGWGCDKDYALRARHSGGRIYVTERSYLNHLKRQTAVMDPSYSERKAEDEHQTGMCRKWGNDWCDTLFDGFPISRTGLTEERLARGGH